MDNVDQLVNGWVQDRLIPGAVLDIRVQGKKLHQAAYGRASITTIFDIASLTKVVSTLPAILLLLQSSELLLDDPVQKIIPEFRHPKVTIEHCLRHTSGLPAAIPGFLERYTTRDVYQELLAQELVTEPGSKVLYSCLGMILLGWVISRVAGLPLDAFVSNRIFKPLGMTNSCFNPPQEWKHRIAPTEWDGSKFLTGEVHDETAYRLGGVAGNAGLFSTAEDLGRYAQLWLYPEEHRLISRTFMNTCLASPYQGRGLGWMVKDGTDDTIACGSRWPDGSFGHTGFTGTSLWIDPSRKLTVVFLTNSVHYGRELPIRSLRPLLHDVIMTSLVDKVGIIHKGGINE